MKYARVKEEESGPSCSLAEALEKQDLFINSTLAQLGPGQQAEKRHKYVGNPVIAPELSLIHI